MEGETLYRNIVDVIEEGQIKLGYRAEEIRLYYPLASLCAFLGETLDAKPMQQALERLGGMWQGTLGRVDVSHKGDRFELIIPAQGVAYVHEHTDPNGFLAQFVRLMERHGTTIEDVLALFRRYSPRVRCEALHNGEFDYLVAFEDGVPSDFYYCITDEGCHLIYHRFTRADYEAFGF